MMPSDRLAHAQFFGAKICKKEPRMANGPEQFQKKGGDKQEIMIKAMAFEISPMAATAAKPDINRHYSCENC